MGENGSRKKKQPTKLEALEERNAELEAANQQLKERLIDSMQGEIEARRKLEAVRDFAGQLQQAWVEAPDDDEAALTPPGPAREPKESDAGKAE